MTQKNLMLLAAAGSAGLLLGAFAFQYIGGLAPCKLCLWQRWPHALAIVLGIFTLIFGPYRLIAGLGGVAAVTTGGIGIYHVGVEQKWWEGPQGCTGFDISNLSASQLMDAINAAPLVRCDDIAWDMLGISMAGWNGLASFAFACLWIAAFIKKST